MFLQQLRLVLVAVVTASSLAAQENRQTPKQSFGTKLSVADAAAKLHGLVTETNIPPGLTPAEQKAYQEHTEWLKSVESRLNQLTHTVRPPRDASTGQASGRESSIGQVSEGVKAPDVDLLKKQIEEESRKFTTLSNVLKTRHDIAMNAIRNMRA